MKILKIFLLLLPLTACIDLYRTPQDNRRQQPVNPYVYQQPNFPNPVDYDQNYPYRNYYNTQPHSFTQPYNYYNPRQNNNDSAYRYPSGGRYQNYNYRSPQTYQQPQQNFPQQQYNTRPSPSYYRLNPGNRNNNRGAGTNNYEVSR